MKKLILMLATVFAASASAIEVGDAVHIPLSAVTCIDHLVKKPCFCEPPNTMISHEAEVTVDHKVEAVPYLRGTVTNMTCALLMQSLSSKPDVLGIVVEKQVTERLHTPTLLKLELSLGLGAAVRGSGQVN